MAGVDSIACRVCRSSLGVGLFSSSRGVASFWSSMTVTLKEERVPSSSSSLESSRSIAEASVRMVFCLEAVFSAGVMDLEACASAIAFVFESEAEEAEEIEAPLESLTKDTSLVSSSEDSTTMGNLVVGASASSFLTVVTERSSS